MTFTRLARHRQWVLEECSFGFRIVHLGCGKAVKTNLKRINRMSDCPACKCGGNKQSLEFLTNMIKLLTR